MNGNRKTKLFIKQLIHIEEYNTIFSTILPILIQDLFHHYPNLKYQTTLTTILWIYRRIITKCGKIEDFEEIEALFILRNKQ